MTPTGATGGPGPSDPGAEPVEEVDEDGAVLRIVTRREMRARGLRHRTVFVAVVDGDDRLLVHQRAGWKDVWPSAWDIAFGGVCGVAEGWADAAARELAEEAGLVAPLARVGGGTWEADGVREVAQVFLARTDDPPTCPDGEVVATDRVPLGALDAWLATRPVCPDSVALVRPHLPEPSGPHPGGASADRGLRGAG
ncbi:NUDIX domain-containing protein [Iamia majanohamensis]|uniref:NUDIX domain-containing protein n=1 Tax=Iamia majanohamensis TaxID=467976 RepID=A0AAE9YDP8_9ACTN|nr:NUDIX domain-containing protein [Iamia majanohamensis]WCO65936.1 NUDIX domain-containing protein [Iamia majanohamensis]